MPLGAELNGPTVVKENLLENEKNSCLQETHCYIWVYSRPRTLKHLPFYWTKSPRSKTKEIPLKMKGIFNVCISEACGHHKRTLSEALKCASVYPLVKVAHFGPQNKICRKTSTCLCRGCAAVTDTDSQVESRVSNPATWLVSHSTHCRNSTGENFVSFGIGSQVILRN